MWLNVLTVLSFICFGFLLDVSSGNAESMDADLVKKINHVNDKLETMVSNYHELLKTVRDDGLKLDSLIKQNQTLNQRLNNTVDKMEKLVTNEQFLNLTIQALQTLTSEQQRAINEEKNMSKKLTSNYSDRLFNVNREVEFLKKQNRYLERTLNITVEKMEKLMSEKETSSYNIENLQNITSQQKHELKQVENKSKESTISIGFSLTLLNDELQELTNSTRIGFKNVNGKILKEKKLLRTEMQNFEKRIKQRINKKLEKIDPGCQQPLQAGSCSDYTVNYFFNTNSSKCERFWYGGCQGNQNNFKSDEECQAACVQVGAIDLQKITKDVIDLNTKVFNLESSTDKSLSNLTLISSKLEKTFKDVQELKPDVDGQWSSWIDTPSSVTCGVGCRLRYRECSNPYPQQGGKKCTGSRNKHVKCQQYDPCPVHGTWSVWSETTCSVTCGVGTSLRYRNCSNPHPQYGGNNCTGKSIDHVICTHTDKCPAQLVQPSIRIEPTFQTVNEFETAEFRCIATGRPTPTVEWRRGTGTMNPSAVISGGVLKIPAALRSDEAQYFCQAINVAGSTLDRTILYVKSNPRPLTLIVRQVAIIATIGNTEQLICYIDDNSVRPTLIWSRNGGLPSGSRQDNGVLTLNNIQSSHAGSYVCSGKTPNGAMGKATATLTVRPEIETTVPNASVTPDRTTISEGTNGTIRCNVTGTPQPKITWSKSRGELTERHQVFRETLIITNAQVEDRGVYICRAENTAGLGQDRAIVEVQRRVKLRLDIYPGISQTIMMGESALFRCRVMGGDPPPNATWSRAGGQPIVSTIDTTDNGVIKFKDVTGEESGVYICTVTNEMGSVTATATLRVIGKVPSTVSVFTYRQWLTFNIVLLFTVYQQYLSIPTVGG
ncbi:basement membrane-specific heparan sulfate proteoglycan core protein-like [Mytilus trossulus]|uniref:basement membrane-specific heparan sulfate proteoglycan core protein-like n=1 Tax=Mytilus trossulus TaxID=6551 RepID=UPI003004BE5C